MLIESQAVEGVAACLHCSDSVGVGKPSEAVAVIKNSAQKKTLLANVHLLLPPPPPLQKDGGTERQSFGTALHVLMDEGYD